MSSLATRPYPLADGMRRIRSIAQRLLERDGRVESCQAAIREELFGVLNATVFARVWVRSTLLGLSMALAVSTCGRGREGLVW